MQKRKVSSTFKRENFFTLEIQERIYPLLWRSRVLGLLSVHEF